MKFRDLPSIEEALRLAADDNTRLTFSQFGEDIIIWSLLQTFGMLNQPGFYVDVGALHPSFLSNTKMLRLMGWSGINIDANPANIQRFSQECPNDINIVAAISDGIEDIEFAIYDAPGLSTADPAMIEKHAQYGSGKIRERVTLRTSPLSRVLEDAMPEGRAIDLMSVDIEGFDLRALRSNNWQRFAPFFLLVEDHQMSLVGKPTSEIFEFVTALGYRLVSVAYVTSIYIRDQI